MCQSFSLASKLGNTLPSDHKFHLLWGYTLLIVTSLSLLSCTSMKQDCRTTLLHTIRKPMNCYSSHSNPVNFLHFEVQQEDEISSQRILRNALSHFITFKCGVYCPWACHKSNALGESLLLWRDKSPFTSVPLQSCWSWPLLKILFILPGSSAVCHTLALKACAWEDSWLVHSLGHRWAEVILEDL